MEVALVWGTITSAARAGELVTQQGASFVAPAGAGGNCGMPIATPDGRYVVFASTAGNLALIGGNMPVPTRTVGNLNVYLRDRTNQTTTLVSVNLAGTGGGNNDSIPRGISTNGQFVLFDSAASNLVPNDINILGDVFVRDVVHGVTTLVSVATNGVSGNFFSSNSVMTPDGRYVAFSSSATNLVPGDTNGIVDVFVRDLVAGTTRLVSTGAIGVLSNGFPMSPASTSDSPAISPDGRYVVYYSSATNLYPGVLTWGEVYARDLVGGTTIWVSSGGRTYNPITNDFNRPYSCNFKISDNDNYVAYEALFGIGSTNGVILRYGLQTGLTDLIATNGNAPPVLAPQNIHTLDMSPDGRFVTYISNRIDAITNTAITIWDAQTGLNTLVSVNTNGAPSAGPFFDSPAVSSNGRYVAFLSGAADLTTNPVSSEYDLYVRDMVAGTTTMVDANANGSGAGVNATTVPVMSADGSTVIYDSRDLLTDSRQEFSQIFAWNRAANSTELVSAHQASLPSQTPDGISGLGAFSLSTNGQFIAFYSDADNLVPGDVNGFRDVFVRNVALGSTALVSVATNGFLCDGISTDPAISGSGRYVAFTSSADNLVANDTNKALDVFVRDTELGTTTLASLGLNGVDLGNADSYSPVMSTDGRYVLFRSKASNLAANSTGSGTENLIWRDLQAGTNYTIATGTGPYGYAVTPDLHYVAFVGVPPGNSADLYVWNSQSNVLVYTNGAAFAQSVLPLQTLALSANGAKLAFLSGSPTGLFVVNLASNNASSTVTGAALYSSRANFQFSADGHYLAYSYAPGSGSPPVQKVYVYDTQAGTSLQISQSFNGQGFLNLGGTNFNSDSPAISPDGRFIAYRSQARIIVPNDFVTAVNMFIYDRVNNATAVASVDLGENSTAGDNSLKPAFSADGSTLAFESWAPDLVTGDFNNGSDIFALSLATLPVVIAGGGGVSNTPPLDAELLLPGAVSPNVAVSWPLATGAAYQVQFKTNLNDVSWQVLAGPPAYVGATGYINDPSPAAPQKFYRIVQTAP